MISTHEIIDLIKKASSIENSEIFKEKEGEEAKNNEMISQENSKCVEDFDENFDFESFLLDFYSEKPKQNAAKIPKIKQNCLEDGTSNSYLYHIIRYFAENVLKEPSVPEIQIKKGKNSDLTVNNSLFLRNFLKNPKKPRNSY